MPIATSNHARPLSGAALGRLLGVSKQATAQWKAAGCPTITENGETRFIVADVFAWRTSRIQQSTDPQDLKTEKLRKLKAEADRVELEVAKVRGELVPIKLFEEVLGKEQDRVRAAIISIPSKYAHMVAERTGCTLAVAQSLLADIANLMLIELRRGDDADEDHIIKPD